MRRRVSRWMAALLVGTLIGSSVPGITLKAEDNNVTITEENIQAEMPQDVEETQGLENSKVDIVAPETPDENGETELTTNSEKLDSTDEAISEETQARKEVIGASEETREMQGEAESIEASLNYLYINEAEQEEGAVQSIVLSWGDANDNVKNASIVVADENANETTLEPINRVDETFLFEHTFSKGTYHIARVNIITATSVKEFGMEELGIRANFGVGRASDENEKSEYFEMESVNTSWDSEATVEAAIATIDENGEATAQDNIAAAMESQGVEKPSVKKKGRSAKASDVVVVLDPGHDSRHAGASGNGVQEEVATLKIAQYCKAELEQYSGVKVYMTRNDAACPFPNSTDNIDDIYKRTDWAASKGADVFVSFHLNSSTSSSAKGAEVYYPASSSEGKALAQQIQNQLVELGLKDRDIKSAQNYAVIKGSMNNGFPGLIIEHAFVSNSSDANSYLKSDADLKRLGVADATGIVQYFGLSKGYWETDSTGKKYYYESGQKVYGEKWISGNWYYFDPKTGAMQTGFVSHGDKTVYYTEDGQMVFGEYAIDGKWYMFSLKNGAMQTGLFDLGTKMVYYNEKGQMVFGEQAIDGFWYMFSLRDGAMITGFYDHGEKVVYYNEEGHLLVGEQAIGGKWYMFSLKDGAMQTGFYDHGEKLVYYDEKGQMLIGEHAVDGKWYMFSLKDGAMTTGFYNHGEKIVYYNEKGQMLFGEQKIDDKKYMFSLRDGAMIIGFYDHGDRVTYYNEEGQMLFGEQPIAGKWYMFAVKDGAMQTGFYNHGDKTVYYNDEGYMLFGEQSIDGSWYMLSTKDGAMQTGFYDLGTKTVYYDKKGRMLFGEQIIDGKEYAFNTVSGAMIIENWYNGKYYGKDGVRVPGMVDTPYTIQGVTKSTVIQMVSYYNKYKAKDTVYPSQLAFGGAPDITSLAKIFYEEAVKEGIKAEVAWAQSMLETGFLKFGGDVSPEQFNFAGLGATGGGVPGIFFPDVRTGVRAQIQHLKAYASPTITKETLKEPCVDPRFDYVKKGSAPCVQDLGGKWAGDKNYGYKIMKMLENLLKC